MKYLVTGKEMKAIDMCSIEEYGIPSLVLMERAALAVANAAESLREIADMVTVSNNESGTILFNVLKLILNITFGFHIYRRSSII